MNNVRGVCLRGWLHFDFAWAFGALASSTHPVLLFLLLFLHPTQEM